MLHTSAPLIGALGRMNTWKPITATELNCLIERELQDCSESERRWYEAHKVPLRSTEIRRGEYLELVFVVAEQDSTVIYYEDVEEGFNISSLALDGSIAQLGFEQWELGLAIRKLAPKGIQPNSPAPGGLLG